MSARTEFVSKKPPAKVNIDLSGRQWPEPLETEDSDLSATQWKIAPYLTSYWPLGFNTAAQ